MIIPSYNSSDTIGKCILSVLNTKYPSLEIIVVDDVSTDGSPKIVEELCQEYPEVIKLIYHNTNSGPAKARNTGAKYAKGEYLFFLDSDTEMLPDALYNFSLRIKNSDAVTGIYHYQPLNRGIAQKYKALFNYFFFSRKGIIEYEVFDASRAGIKTEVFKKMGGFHEGLRWGMDYESEEFGYRLCKKYKNLLDPSIMVKHVFPNIKELTKTYFLRVSLWMEVFLKRREFESGGVTSDETGISTASLLIAIVAFPLYLINPYLSILSLLFLAVYIYGYIGFFCFVLKKNMLFLPAAILINLYFTLIIGCAAFWGAVRVFTGRSIIKKVVELF